MWDDFGQKKSKLRNKSPYYISCSCGWVIGSKVIENNNNKCPTCGQKHQEK